MYLERITLLNFRCFGDEATTITFSQNLTAFVGLNGAGKTAAMQALQRLFGITNDQRRVRKQDFHVPNGETESPPTRSFQISAVLAFPELDDPLGDHSAVPEFFRQSVAEENGKLKCVIRIEGTLTDDSTSEGAIWTRTIILPSLEDTGDDPIELKPAQRALIQLVYVPATRDGGSQVTAFLKGRLWRSVNWSERVRASFAESGQALNQTFSEEAPVLTVTNAVTQRWQELHTGGTFTTPIFNPIDAKFDEFIRRVEVQFRPDEFGRARGIEELSDGQRSLFHLSLTSATLDIERAITDNPDGPDFSSDTLNFPVLTLIAIEEPENNLAPFYLSRIVKQVESLTAGGKAQAFISSHSPSILSRIEPADVRHFRIGPTRTAIVREISLPPVEEEAYKFVREAVRAFPELYFARFVVLGEGASEEVVLPRLAEALHLSFDRSFVCTVPLGGRHVNHLWKLLSDLQIPYATLLDFDWGRKGGGWGRIKQTAAELLKIGTAPIDLFGVNVGLPLALRGVEAINPDNMSSDGLREWFDRLARLNVFFCKPLDLDYSMLSAYPVAYQLLPDGGLGPSERGNPKDAVLGDHGFHDAYDDDETERLRWYRYLFLGRGKPSTHMRILNRLDDVAIAASIPPELRALLNSIEARLNPPQPEDEDDEPSYDDIL